MATHSPRLANDQRTGKCRPMRAGTSHKTLWWPAKPSLRCRSQDTAQHSRIGREFSVSRRYTLVGLAIPMVLPSSANAGFKKELRKRTIPIEEYALSSENGLRFFDLEEGRGKTVQRGDIVVVHFDCIYRGVDAVSSRYARTLGGNRTIAEPYEFVAGERVSEAMKKSDGGSAGGLYVGSSGPKPPQALSTAVLGMKPGGKRMVVVDNPDLGYAQGIQEIPPGATFELRVELLSVP